MCIHHMHACMLSTHNATIACEVNCIKTIAVYKHVVDSTPILLYASSDPRVCISNMLLPNAESS